MTNVGVIGHGDPAGVGPALFGLRGTAGAARLGSRQLYPAGVDAAQKT